MRTDPTKDQIARYRDDGFLQYPQFLTQDETDALRDAVLEPIVSLGRRKVAGDGADMEEGDEFYDRVFTQRLNLWRISKAVHACVASPALGTMLTQLAGVPAFRIWHDQALIKEPFANHTALHTDNPFWSFHSRDAISIWIALEDATLENGGLCFLPSSHKKVDFQRTQIGTDFGSIFHFYPALNGIEPRPMPMKAGDCSFHNGLVIHGAGVNMTTGRRAALSCAYMPEGSRYNGQHNVLPEHYANGLEVGEVLEDDRYNPPVPVLD